MPAQTQTGIRLVSQLFGSTNAYVEMLNSQIELLDSLKFEATMAPDKIRENVNMLLGTAYFIEIPEKRIPKIGYEYRFQDSKAPENEKNFNILKNMIKAAIEKKIFKVVEMQNETIQKMGSISVNLGGEE